MGQAGRFYGEMNTLKRQSPSRPWCCLAVVVLLLMPSCRKANLEDSATPDQHDSIPSSKGMLSSIAESERRAALVEAQLKKIAAGLVVGRVPSDMHDLPQSLLQIAGKFKGSDRQGQHSEVHVFQITNSENSLLAIAMIELKAKLASGQLGCVVGKLGTKWNINNDGSLSLQDFTQATFQPLVESPIAWFTEQTDSTMGKEPGFLHHLSHGIDYWISRIESAHGIDAFIRNGMALGDVDGDNRDDVYICQPGGLPNRLFMHQADGTVKEVEAGVGILDHTSSALFVDIDNDGDQDLILATPAGISLLENEGGLSFAARGVLRTNSADCHALAAADFNMDGNLDIYITFALGDRIGEEGENLFLFHDARDGGENQLFSGDGNWSFSEVTTQTGLNQGNDRHSLAAMWYDFDLDGDPDLYVANDYGANQLYRNDLDKNGKRVFKEIAAIAGVEDKGAGMSASWGDFNRDGLPDLYVGNMYSNAGSRITSQPDFPIAQKGGLLDVYKRFAKGNTLLSQIKPNQFLEQTGMAAMGRWAWSSVFADLDNDGWEDLFVANGYITATNPDDL